jgi:hypothetical protein
MLAGPLPPDLMAARIRFLSAIPRLPNFKPDFVSLQQLDPQPLHPNPDPQDCPVLL